jgi:uncharacterized protein (TIGR02271 family)
VPDKIITALFDSRTDAEGAIRDLSSVGIGQDRVQIATESKDLGSGGALGRTGNLATVLNDRTLPPEDRETFAEGLRRGAYLLTARVNEAAAPEVVRILDHSNAVDLDDRAQQWRTTGWAGPALGGATETRTGGLSASGDMGQRVGRVETAGDDQSIPVVQEELKVGKREVASGSVRVHSYVTETPVQEQITLREEHVSVERRPVDQVTKGTEAMLQERTIEFTETSEEAVVAKEARVVEEVVVRKEVGERIETIEDTVRRTDVEIEDSRGAPRR